MKYRITLLILSSIILTFSLAAGQGVTLENVEGSYGLADDSLILADGSTSIVFNLRLTGLATKCGGFTTGFRISSPDGAQWNSTDADTLPVGTGWDVMWDSLGGFFENHFSVTGADADTIGLGAIAIYGGLPADFDEVAFTITIGPIAAEHEGKTITLDSCFYPPNGYWVLAGSGGSFSWGGPYTFHLASPTSVAGAEGNLPTSFGLGQNYPNPFNPTTEITFDVPHNSHVTISVYNILGRKVATVVDEKLSAGSYVRTWNGISDAGSMVSSGIYLYKLQAEDFAQTRKMMLLK